MIAQENSAVGQVRRIIRPHVQTGLMFFDQFLQPARSIDDRRASRGERIEELVGRARIKDGNILVNRHAGIRCCREARYGVLVRDRIGEYDIGQLVTAARLFKLRAPFAFSMQDENDSSLPALSEQPCCLNHRPKIVGITHRAKIRAHELTVQPQARSKLGSINIG